MEFITTPCFSCDLDGSTQEPSHGTVDSCSPSVIFTILFVLCGLVTIFSNIINLLALYHAKQCFSENTKLCFQAVAIVDFFVGLFCCTFHSIRFSGLWIATTRPFSIVGVIGCSTLFNQSIMILACVSVDRYLAVTRPLRYHAIVTKQRMLILIFCGIVIGTINANASLTHKILTDISDLKFASVDIANSPIIIIYFGLILVSAGITTFCNVALVTLARKHRRRIFAQSTSTDHKDADAPVVHAHPRNKDVRTVFAVTGAFYITWGAQVSVNIVSAATGYVLPCIVRNILLIFVISNSFWNALIYMLMNSLFRKAVVRMFTRNGNEANQVTAFPTVAVENF